MARGLTEFEASELGRVVGLLEHAATRLDTTSPVHASLRRTAKHYAEVVDRHRPAVPPGAPRRATFRVVLGGAA